MEKSNLKKLKICFVSYEYPPNGGGIATYIENVGHYLSELGHAVTIITAETETLQKSKTINDNLRIVTIPKLGNGFRGYWKFQFNIFTKFRELNNNYKFDIVELPDYLGDGCLITLLKGLFFRNIKVITRLHSSFTVLNKYYYFINESKYLGIRIGEYINYRFANILISPSEILARLSRKYSHQPIIMFPLPISPNLTVSSKIIKQYDLIFPSRLQDGKGIFIFINACLKILEKGYDLNVLLLGGDTVYNDNKETVYNKLLRTIPEKYLAHFHFTLNINRKYLTEYYRASSICVIPSIYENFPFVCLESMAQGLPVIASSNTGTAEIVKKYDCGLIFDNADINDLVQKIELLLENQQQREVFGNNGITAIKESLNPTKLMQAYSKLLIDIANGN